jgi:3-methyl-2-oxobutanoate hydroxymethyltransferase
MSAVKKDFKKVTTHVLQEMKRSGEKIAMLTAYDYSMAKLVDSAGIDVILVGDSASNVMAGHETTLPITLDQMIYHAASVVRAVERALVVVDLPFGSYQGNSKEALHSAIKVMKESGGHAVKMEGGAEIAESVQRILSAGIPEKLIEDAKILEKAGVFSIVLEKIPAALAAKVAKTVAIPVIGIGAGADIDGQVLVLHDMLGMNNEFSPRFLRRYANLFDVIQGAVKQYSADIKSKNFPNEKEQY